MIRIALISDIHFGKLSRTAEFSVPGEPIRDENSGGKPFKESMVAVLKDQNVKYLCVAGDLTSVGSPQEFVYCKDMLLDLMSNLGLPKESILLGLGNHDVDWKISSLHKSFDSSNSGFPKELVQEQYQKIAASASIVNLEAIPGPKVSGPAPYTGIIENEDFIMFILNTGWCCTEDQAISHGKLDALQLSWFAQEASKYRQSEKWKIILMHHHPFNYSYPVAGFDVSLLEEGSAFLDIAGENGFHLVLHGHRHHPRAETHHKNQWINPITFVCAGSFAVNSYHRSGGSIPNTMHIIELTDEIGVIKLLTYQYAPAEGWIPLVRNCPETPLDKTMMFGKIFAPSDVEESIRKLALVEGEIKWSDLDECLHFMPIDKLNEQMKTQLADTHKIIGNLPEEIYLIKKG